MSAVGDLLLTPRDARPRGRSRSTPATAIGVLAPAGRLGAHACAVGVALAVGARPRRAVVCLTGGSWAGAPPRRGDPLAGALELHGLRATARGRLLLVELPGDPAAAAHGAWRARSVAADTSFVLGTARRSAALDEVLADLAELVVVRPSDPAAAALVVAAAEALGPPLHAVDDALGPVARVLATRGLAAPAALRAVVA